MMGTGDPDGVHWRRIGGIADTAVAGDDVGSGGEWSPLPLFPELSPTETIFESSDAPPFDDVFASELAATNAVRRLQGIGFLGALDYVLYGNGSGAHRRRHNRYEHTLGVGRLADRYAMVAGLSKHDRRVLVAAGLLHDVGHGPLSHTLEPVFRSRFGITHHSAGREIVEGRSPLGDEIGEVLRRYKIERDEVIEMIEGRHGAPHAWVFASPINLDTIEGIHRTSMFMRRERISSGSLHLVDLIARSPPFPTEEMDTFWELKHRVYNLFIHTSLGLAFDGLAQAYMTRDPAGFAERDFLKTEQQLRHKHPALFHMFAWARVSRRVAHERIRRTFGDILDHELDVPARTFAVRHDVELHDSTDLQRRYVQYRRKGRSTIRDILAKPRLEGI